MSEARRKNAGRRARPSRRGVLLTGLGVATGLAAPAAPSSPVIVRRRRLRIGLLWSLTGHLAVIERPSHDVGMFWIDEMNALGGVAGMEIEPVVIDARSDLETYRRGVAHLLVEEKVTAVFGGYTSASRRAVMPLVTRYGGLFYYPTCYEGRECWQHIICTGPIANQHSYDLMPFMAERFGPRCFFVGSNYVWPVESNRNARRWLEDAGGSVIGEAYVPLGQDDFDAVFAEIIRLSPDWVFSTVVGDSDLYFRRAFQRFGFTPERMPTASLTTSEIEVRTMGEYLGAGHYLSAPYFQSLDNPTNKRFVEAFLASAHGASGVTHYNMEETYLSFLYFAKAVEAVVAAYGHDAVTAAAIRTASAGLELSADESPEGRVWIDPDNFNSHLTPKIGRFNAAGQVELLFSRGQTIAPEPFLLYPQRGTCRKDGLHLPDGRIVRAAN